MCAKYRTLPEKIKELYLLIHQNIKLSPQDIIQEQKMTILPME